jgi:hypothetical protein
MAVKTMPVPPTEDNPHGWGHIEQRKVLEHYQLSPRVQIVVEDIIKVSKGSYWINKENVKVSMDTMKGQWKVTGIFEGNDGLEMDIVHCWPGGLFGSTTTIRITGEEYPSPIVDIIIRRPFKIRLAAPKFKRKMRQKAKSKKISKPAPKKAEKVEEVDWDAIKNIVKGG